MHRIPHLYSYKLLYYYLHQLIQIYADKKAKFITAYVADESIDKIKNVIDTFNENRADILLIIKQHSLIGAALRELTPEIYAERVKKVVMR